MLQAMVELLGSIIDPIAFQELRATQQLGYVVNVFAHTTNSYPGLVFVVRHRLVGKRRRRRQEAQKNREEG